MGVSYKCKNHHLGCNHKNPLNTRALFSNHELTCTKCPDCLTKFCQNCQLYFTERNYEEHSCLGGSELKEADEEGLNRLIQNVENLEDNSYGQEADYLIENEIEGDN